MWILQFERGSYVKTCLESVFVGAVPSCIIDVMRQQKLVLLNMSWYITVPCYNKFEAI